MTRREPSLEFVVAHYNEDLYWLKGHHDSCVIYSKGGPKNAPPHAHQTLPNIGREGHTYLHHIVARYDTLADITVFLQGRIDDHVSISLDEMKDIALKTKPYQVTTFPFRELETFDHWEGIPWEEYPSWRKWWPSNTQYATAPRTPAGYWQALFPGSEIPAAVGFQPGALFAVRKETIRQYPLAFWQRMMNEFFEGDMAHINPETGHYNERFILAILNPSEYICWDKKTDVSRQKRNQQGQLAKGRWHVTPKWREVDEATLPPAATQLETPPASDDSS